MMSFVIFIGRGFIANTFSNDIKVVEILKDSAKFAIVSIFFDF